MQEKLDDKIIAVRKMHDYINEHAQENISLADLAAVSLYSPWYSARIFKELTGVSPADYIRRIKLSRAALRLRDESCKVIDVALDSGYGSVDGFQRAFFQEFGCNPGQYAKNPVPLYLFTPYSVKYKPQKKEILSMENIKNVFVQVIEKPERKVLIKRGIKAEEYWAYCQEVGCDVWGLLTSIKSISGEPVCLWLSNKYIKPGTSKYVQGVEVPMDYSGEIPDGFDLIELPASKYLMFQGEPFEEEDFREAISIVQSSIEKYDPAIISYQFDSENPRIQLEPIGSRGYIEMLPIK